MSQANLFAIVVFFSALLSSSSYANDLCKAVSKRDRATVARDFGRDPASLVKKATDVLHNQFRAHNKNQPNQIFSDSSDLRIQMSIFINYFAMADWTKKLNEVTRNQRLDSLRKTEWEYVFTHWMRVRYLSSVQELVRAREMFQVFREPALAAVKQTVVQRPAAMVITDYRSFACETDLDQRTYDCSKTFVMVETQLSPQVMCSNRKLARQANFKYLVDVSKGGVRITDVEYNGTRLFQDAIADIEGLFTNKSDAATVLNSMKIWSFRSTAPTSKDDLQAFRANFGNASLGPAKASSRMPASQ
ncbi:MAG: hypothetical protein HRT45_04760 [Bdellovibrionales bacterium]|nr:hypothetical protein [Bdellovibrionales bacterium]